MTVSTEINRLYNEARSGQRGAERELFEYLSARFLLFVHRRIRNRELAEEIVQQALMTIADEYKRVEIERSFSAWTYKILDNRIMAAVQQQKRELQRQEVNYEIAAAKETSDPADTADLKRQLLDCLKKITSHNRRYTRIMNLHVQGFATDEICKRMEIFPATFYSLLSRGRKMLERCLESGEIQ